MASFEVETQETVSIIRCPESIDVTSCKVLDTLSRTWLETKSTLFVFDFKQTVSITNQAYRIFVSMNQALKSSNRFQASININKSISNQLKGDGMEAAFSPVATIDDALKKFGLKVAVPAAAAAAAAANAKPQINVEFVNPFIHATFNVFNSKAKTEFKPQKPYMKKAEHSFDVAIVGVIQIVSPQFNGSIRLCFPKDVFLRVYEKIRGEMRDEINTETQGLAGELLNLIFEVAEKELRSSWGYTIQKAVPTIFTDEITIISLLTRGNATLVVPFSAPIGNIQMEIAAG